MQKIVTVGLQNQETSDARFAMQMIELKELVDTAGGQVVAEVTQKREKIDNRFIIGRGKLNELDQISQAYEADMVIFYQQMSPSQNNNVQAELDIPVIDRVQLILDIFAQRAQSVEGKLQVALAQNEYLLPRLSGFGQMMSRLVGGIGSRGPGETKLEQDRRVLRKEIQKIKKELAEVEAHRERTREKRKASSVFQLGLIGYTNAGKSTIINNISSAETYQADQLFATLTPLTRTFSLPNHFKLTITDTVGFIQYLPPMIIDAFHSTLEENRQVDLLLVVVDASSPYAADQEAVVKDQLKELGMDTIPVLFVYNKADLLENSDQGKILFSQPSVFISAQEEEGIEALITGIVDQMKTQYDYLEMTVSPAEINRWIKDADILYIEEMRFDKDKDNYHVKFYKPKDYLLG
ncbi:GTPase HflX [Aerococcus kribbianus]|uniref:GTPase HflX n=1 Tax=Aerococcus kribbianus TaxID=2999064 RepID=A0A9X3JFE7_9LACT|nr:MULTISPECIES: GTPase HflX [unclassified Aerococcus]MCZ0717007.1 GTPase HflX [Aerococcus sp. YH-aer221]MCZ0725295.1 GTPase HflX [Aerococcus sp. YH-aer222]